MSAFFWIREQRHAKIGKCLSGKIQADHLERRKDRRKNSKMGKIFYIIGKSATGKDHIYKGLLEKENLHLQAVILYTTRPKRAGEENGREYFFTDEEHLEEMRQAGKIIEERVYQTVYGPWYYFTAEDGQIRLEQQNYLGIGTLESFVKLRDRYGAEAVIPIYIETEDGIRLARALKRERKQEEPKYEEMCRRFLADSEDFSEDKIRSAGIDRRFENNALLEDTMQEAAEYIRAQECIN